MYPEPEVESGLITSDSDFENALSMTKTHVIKSAENSKLGLNNEANKSPTKKMTKSNTKEFGPKSVSKKFKALISSNYNRTEYQQSDKNQTDATTKQCETRNEQDEFSSKKSKDIERKFKPKAISIQDKSWKKKTYKDDHEQK